ncbi:MAG: GumC family protein [Armatimonadota bacterium]
METRVSLGAEKLSPAWLFVPVLARWRFVVCCAVIGAICGLVVSFLLPSIYESQATIFPQQSRNAVSMLSQLPLSLNMSATPSGYYTALLKSDTMLSRTLDHLHLIHDHRFTNGEQMSFDQALRRLRQAVIVKENRDGSVSVTVRSRDPNLSARVANTMIGLLGGMVETVSNRKVAFISQRLRETMRDLRRAEEEMRRFQETNDIAGIDEQTRAAIRELAELDGRLLATDVELQEISSRLHNAGDLESLVEDEVRKRALESGRSVITRRREELQRRLALLPRVATEYARLERRIELLNQTYTILSQQYQLERITQQGEGGDYQVIDRARPERIRVAPHTFLNTLIGGILGLILAVVLVSFMAPFSIRSESR